MKKSSRSQKSSLTTVVSRSAADPFDTATLRAAVLDAWRSSPTRYREDANVEEDYARGAYRDRLVVELAQNAADAARAANVPCRMRIRLTDEAMFVANTGAPLSLAGVHSMAAMRASAKADQAVGRFGVGFAAVLSVTDAPAIASRDAGVRFSRADTADLMRSDGDLAPLLQQREPPVLRLPFPDERTTADHIASDGDYDTVVVLPWRDVQARELALRSIESIDDALFIALPDLAELVVEVTAAEDTAHRRWSASRDDETLIVEVNESQRRWRLFETTGRWADADLDEAPFEERGRQTWSLTWAVPVSETGRPTTSPWSGADDAIARVIHAPTPTDEALALPALLVGDFPVDASRRRLRSDAMANRLIDAAIDSYIEVVRDWATTRDVEALQLVPRPDLVGPIDGRIRLGVREGLMRTPWVRRASDQALVSPQELVAVEPANDALVQALAPHVSDLVSAAWLPHIGVLRTLGMATRRWSDVWDVLTGMQLSSEAWHDIYSAASELDAASLEGLPVLLTSGRLVRDARRCVASPDTRAEQEVVDALATLGVAVVDPAAMHPLLERLGVHPFDPRVHLGGGFVTRVNVAADVDPIEARDLLRAAVVAIEAAGVTAPITELGGVVVPTEDGAWRPAMQVAMPTSVLIASGGDGRGDRSYVLDATLASEHGAGWLALGVIDALTVVEVTDLPLDSRTWDDLTPDGADWCSDVTDDLGAESPGELLATSVPIVRGLQFLDGMAWSSVLPLLAAPGVRAAVVDPAFVLDGAGSTRSVRSPAAWWLADLPLFDGRPAVAVRLPGDDRLAPFFDELTLPSDADRGLLEAIGVHTTLAAWLQTFTGVGELLEAMAEESTVVPDDVTGELYAAIERFAVDQGAMDHTSDLDDVEPPRRLRALVGGSWRLVDADDVVVARAPHHAAVLRSAFIPGGAALAEVLDLDESDDALCGASHVASTGVPRRVPDGVRGLTSVSEYYEHDQLSLTDHDLDWWVTDDNQVHACTVAALARGLAWASGQWSRRWQIEAKLSGEDDQRDLEAYYDS
jgi:hypothetical protein